MTKSTEVFTELCSSVTDSIHWSVWRGGGGSHKFLYTSKSYENTTQYPRKAVKALSNWG